MRRDALWSGMFAKWVAQSLEHAGGMSQAELSRRLTERLRRKIDSAAVNKITKGTRRLAADELLAIAEITNYPLVVSLAGDLMPDHDDAGFNIAFLVRLLTIALEWRGLSPDKARNMSASLVEAARRHPDRQESDLSEDQERRLVHALAAAFGIPPQR